MKRLSLICLLLILSTFAVNAQQSDDLIPLPTENRVVIMTDTPQLFGGEGEWTLSSYDDIVSNYDDSAKLIVSGFMWSAATDTVEYVLKIKDLQTGAKLKVKAPVTLFDGEVGCSDQNLCGYFALHGNLLWQLEHNQQYSAVVIAKKFDGTKTKSNKVTFRAHLIEASIPMHPSGEVEPTFQGMQWIYMPGISQKLVIKNTLTGEMVFSETIDTTYWCGKINDSPHFCAYPLPQSVIGEVVDGQAYTWFVKSKAPNGLKVKSEKATFNVKTS